MGLFSLVKKAGRGIKGAAGKTFNAAKGVGRTATRIVSEIGARTVNGVTTLIPAQKKMRLQVYILRDESGTPLLNDTASRNSLQNALDYAISTFKEKFDIKIIAYGSPVIQVLSKPAPSSALSVSCDAGAASNELGEAGDYFASHLAGWNVIPLNLGFPISVFIVRSIKGKIGCSMGPLTDYVTVSIEGAKSLSTMAHELGHCCGLLHRDDRNNLMYPSNDGRGNNVTSWQKIAVRNSRHCTIW